MMQKPNTGNRELRLDEFPPHSYEQWKAAAEALLKGAPFDKRLRTPTAEGITLEPIYRREDLEGIPLGLPGMDERVRGSRIDGNVFRSWEISQELKLADPDECGPALADAMERGQTEVRLVLARTDCGAQPDGLVLHDLNDLARTLVSIDLSSTPVVLDAGMTWPAALALLLALAQERGVDPAQLRGGVFFDPLAAGLSRGEIPGGDRHQYDLLDRWLQYLVDRAPGLGLLAADATPVHDAGGSAVEELAWLAGSLAETLRQLSDRGRSPVELFPRLRLQMAVGGSFFMEIAKLRAARRLFSLIAEAWGQVEAPLHLFVRSGRWNLTCLDPHVNLLRTTTGAFAAVVGGCDSLHVAPFDEVIRPSDTFSRRLARNIQLILRDECELKRVIDPAGGSYAVEVLTEELARSAWERFRELEREGGLLASLKTGRLQEQIEKVAGERRRKLARRSEVLVGCNMYPLTGETPLADTKIASDSFLARWRERQELPRPTEQASDPDEAIAAARRGLPLTALLPKEAAERLQFRPLPPGRAAEEFEELRAKHRKRKVPLRVFQANLGPSRLYRARADWTSGFFQVGGFIVHNEEDFATADEAAAAALASAAPVVVLTGSDETYVEAVPQAARILKSAPRPPRILVAGAPGEAETAWRKAGVDDFVHLRVNCLEILQNLLESEAADDE